MIKLKDLLFENEAPNIFVPRRIEDRLERMISLYVRNGSKGNLLISEIGLTELPDILKNVSVGGTFDCSRNNLTSLINAPKYVDGTFYCHYNNLTSLKGSKETVIDENFYCTNNKLTSLEGAPKTVKGHFFCYQNSVKFTEKQVRAVSDVKGMVGV